MSNLKDFVGTMDALTKVVEEHGGIVCVDFSAPWCGSCRRIAGVLPTIAGENPNILFLKVDIEQNPELKEHYAISALPHLKFLEGVHDGKPIEVGIVQGPHPNQIKDKIAELTEE